MAVDFLADARWECLATNPDLVDDPARLDSAPGEWMEAAVPGTAAAALRAVGATDEIGRDLDAVDWWFRTRFTTPDAVPDALLTLEGIATLGDVWCNGAHVAQTENMFVGSQHAVPVRAGENEIVIRCRSLTAALRARRPRPRWKTYLVEHQQLRWFRTTLLGRLPGWAQVPSVVGPWRPVTLTSPRRFVTDRRVVARCDGADGIVEIQLRLRGPLPASNDATVCVGTTTTQLPIDTFSESMVVKGVVRVPRVRRWWPHTHGDQPRYPLSVTIDGEEIDLGAVGFRTVEVDRTDDRFVVSVNGVPIFCRGACWFPPDPVTLNAPASAVRETLELARAAHMNMVRVPATTVYPDQDFWDACDEFGLLVWQDCMFAFMDYPDDDAFGEEVRRELVANLAPLGGRPSLAIVCGNQEVEEIPAMMGLPRDRWEYPLFDKAIAGIVHDVVPGVPFVSSNPTGGDLPFRMNAGVSQYFGVGGYLRSLSDVRRDDVRFAAECLALATPPERDFVDAVGGGAARAGHDPEWKLGVHRDSGRSWDLEDVRDHYVRALFDVDPLHLRYTDPERALDLGRATSAELVAGVFTEWRRPGSSCGGGLVLALRDLRPGAGWGLIDARGVPKAPYYALRRVLQPLAVLVTDEGLNGLYAHLCNDRDTPFSGSLSVTLYAHGELPVEEAQLDCHVGARGARVVDIATMFDGFRDLAYAFRFTPATHDVVAVNLHDDAGDVVSDAIHLPLGLNRPFEDDLGLAACTTLVGDEWTVTVKARRFAQSVAIEVPGFVPSDSWVHLLPGVPHHVVLTARPGNDQQPRGTVRALNGRRTAPIRAEVK